MTEQNTEHDEELRASEEVEDGIVDIYEDVPDFDESPWANAVIPGVQDDEAVGE